MDSEVKLWKTWSYSDVVGCQQHGDLLIVVISLIPEKDVLEGVSN